MSCQDHSDFPRIMECDTCRLDYEDVLRKWQGEQGVAKFRLWYQKEKLLGDIRND